MKTAQIRETGIHSNILCALDSGNEMGLSLILNADVHDYYCSSTRSYGFKVLVHNPNDLPRVAYYGVGNNAFSRICLCVPFVLLFFGELQTLHTYTHTFVAIPVGYESRLVITPVLAEASDAILRVPKHIRNCIFENENFLKFYR